MKADLTVDFSYLIINILYARVPQPGKPDFGPKRLILGTFGISLYIPKNFRALCINVENKLNPAAAVAATHPLLEEAAKHRRYYNTDWFLSNMTVRNVSFSLKQKTDYKIRVHFL